MYRISRIFVSDIAAGENLLRNGFIPVYKEGGKTDHGVLFAANGTCKTTLLSFILSVFCPGRQRFVQHLQSSGDKTLEQYLIPGRPAVVLIDLLTEMQPNLFEAKPVKHLVLGQLLYRHRSMPDKTERMFFIAQSGELFDEMRQGWDELISQEKPYKVVRDYLSSRVQKTTSQKEWAETLERIGLDPWLIERQVDFARTEGGIKDAFKFPSESDFLSFFLGCVTDLDAAVTLRSRIEQDLRKMQERPHKLAQLKTVRSLKERIGDFDAIASEWRRTNEAISDWKEKLGEGSHVLQEAEKTAGEAVEALTPVLEDARFSHQQTVERLETITSNVLLVQQYQLSQDISGQKKQLSLAQDKLAALKGENIGVKAADFIAGIRSASAEAENKQEALNVAGNEIEPMQKKLDSLAARYHVRLDAERTGLEDGIEELNKKLESIEKERHDCNKRHEEAVVKKKQLGKQMGQLDDRLRKADARRSALSMEPGEEPGAANKRLKELAGGLKERMEQLRKEVRTVDESIESRNRRWLELQAEYSRGEVQLTAAREKVESEASERKKLAADPVLVRVAGTKKVEVSSADLLSRLDDAFSRVKGKIEEQSSRRMQLQQTIRELDGTETLAVDDQTQRLISYYHENGISTEELKSYPDYLVNIYDSPEEIGHFIEGDPARFTGIMAATEEIIEKVRKLDVPSWLHRPVVISTPCSKDQLVTVEQAVITPPSPEVYSKRHMVEVKERYAQELTELQIAIADSEKSLRELEKASRNLHVYREKYPDKAAIATLTEQVQALEGAQKQFLADIEKGGQESERLKERKSELEEKSRLLGADLVRINQQLEQVTKWIKEFAGLEGWQNELEEKGRERAELDNTLNSCNEQLEKLREDIFQLKGDMREQKTLLKRLDELAAEMARPRDIELSETERKEALAMDLASLKHLHETVKDDLRQLTSELGIDSLRKDLEKLQDTLARYESRFEKFRRENEYDEQLAEEWAAKSAEQREERLEQLSAEITEIASSISGLENKIEFMKKDLGRMSTELSVRKSRGIKTDLSDNQLAESDPDGLMHQLEAEKSKLFGTRDQLKKRCTGLEGQQASLAKWHQEIQLVVAENKRFEPIWDEHSPRFNWPELRPEDDEQPRLEAVARFRDELRQMIDNENDDRKTVDKAQRRMRTAFDRLQRDLQDDGYKNELPALVDELRSHDAESLGDQAAELMATCDDIAGNFETDLEMTQRFMESLVDMLLQHSREYHQKIQAASKEILPEDVFIYGGKPILKAGARLDFTKHQDGFRQSVENWLYELIEQDRLPEVNPRVGNKLGAELLYQLLGAASGRKIFGIRILKCDDTGNNYEPVGKDLGSGGEALTIAVLLYALLISMRKRRKHNSSSYDLIPAFLVLDNPLGVCNRSDFLDAQLKVARAMGLQCVYLTGINDRESLDLFELRVAIRKGEKKLNVDGSIYNGLEVTELNVEKG